MGLKEKNLLSPMWRKSECLQGPGPSERSLLASVSHWKLQGALMPMSFFGGQESAVVGGWKQSDPSDQQLLGGIPFYSSLFSA